MPRSSNRRLKVCLLSRHPLVLEELQRVLARPNIHLKSRKLELPTPRGTHELWIPRATVYVIDAHAPRPATEALAETIRERYPHSGLIFVADSFEENSAFALLALGAKGLLSYVDAHDQLPRALQAVAARGYWVPRALLSSFVDSVIRTSRKGRSLRQSAQLSPRESQVLEQMLENLSNKEIAAKIKISERTVKFHVSHILTKYGVGRRADLILLWYQQHPN